MRKVPNTKLGDRLHRGFVWTCIGITGLGVLNVVLRGWEYIMYVRPVRKLEEAKIEKELLGEGTGL